MNTCIYHANCADGIMSALVCSLAHPGIRLFPASDRKNPPPPEFIDGQEVVIADFSYPLDVIEDIAKRARSLTLLDHHKSAQKILGHLPYCVFDNNKSGAQICWDFFFPGHPQPMLLQAVGESDRGKRELPFTSRVMIMAEVLPFEVEAWMDFMTRLENNPENELRHADAIAEWRSKKVDKMVKKSYLTNICGYTIPAINTSEFKSEVGRRLCVGYPFAVIFSGSEGRWYISLRSEAGGIDVSELAEKLGGGGHRNAAAFISDKAPVNIEKRNE